MAASPADSRISPDGNDYVATQAPEEWHLAPDLRRLEGLCTNRNQQPKKLGVSWKNLTVQGVDSKATLNENVVSQFMPFGTRNTAKRTKTILDDSSGTVNPGEMLLVLERPGAGCTTLLSVLANNRLGYESVSGEVQYGTMSAKEDKAYRGQIVMSTEDDVFFPTLSVQDTIDLAARMKTPRFLPTGFATSEDYAQSYKTLLLRALDISHTAKTKVGDAYIRGVLGGERKRVSILECLATGASIFCWDNSTRGLDAGTALDYVKAIRALTDILGLTSIFTLYQAGNGIYEQFDKVLVLDEGRTLYYGPRDRAVPFMEDLGFICNKGANSGDFLTGVTVPTERRIAKGQERSFPRDGAAIAACYSASELCAETAQEHRRFNESEDVRADTAAFQQLVQKVKHRGLRQSPVTANFFKQVKYAVIRQYQLLWGDKPTMIIKQGATLIQALIGGSLFYNAPENNLGLFIKGAIFFSTLYHALLALGEVTDSFTGRPVLAQHRAFALYHPAAFTIAQVLADLPILSEGYCGSFFTFLIISYVNALSMTQFFRAVGAGFPTFDAATKISGLSFVALFMYMGYMIIKPEMHPWFVWIYWINPMAYSYEALIGNEFHDTIIPCAGPNLIPNGPGYGDGGKACVGVTGARLGADSLTGDEYLAGLPYNHNHISREEKLRYVDTIIDLLELGDLEHTLIGVPGSSLSIEKRKRVTIGVELVAKPSILIFLDEPTFGLDGQAAYNTVRFLRKLAEAGQAILVTIHQPSAQLFAQFDTLLLLCRGGKPAYFGEIGEKAETIKSYLHRHGAVCPPEANPAEFMIEVVTGSGAGAGRDWAQTWLDSPENKQLTSDINRMVSQSASDPSVVNNTDDNEFATSMWTQTKLVTQRMNVSLFRNTDYVTNKFAMHVLLALLNGFTFWMIGDSLSDLQLNLFTIFNVIFVAPGVISQLQPLFIDRRDIFEAWEKKSKMYHWAPFVTGLIVSEFPYLICCAVLYYSCWYFAPGLNTSPYSAGSVFFAFVMFELLYTGVGQSIAAYAPNAVFASLVNPLVIVTLVSFCGVTVPYSQIQPFWRYWLYYLDPFNYLMSCLLVFTTWDKPVNCTANEVALFDPLPGQTCAGYLQVYQSGMGMATNLLNPNDTSACQVCQYTTGADYLRTLNLDDKYFGWRNAGLVAVFAIAIDGLVYLMMKLRTKQTKKAES
ncbi:Putative ABC transporter-like, ATP-binding domain, ABC-2 type transporter, ABC-transporter [Septoria linicola]|uniref:ABC transporter-like, ATP-binding domain, ABC-2 type transporter, ABC-transporter n=1 Tax=Septoria linicola TaxID=215465 RepID=A0A9Q9EJS6_9PEZI|nr:putative ABC transporter-like, ATP-binding domain, ABC-2 type transporter, ABC-transporter [Septoria linicola]USW52502.1 Putative ABC transporter-like, ATP-binding domain, ABC-2 type transporter, ABC-transporter [Septoria linicola]